ncbi:SDR family NAD(P)-dependent oxidoreductase [Algihabitans albus]|uniref:SDR family NAD(P)-dependent oxidoreductase n=1 Tax=Algihabitans albus TaxID=2164067 RepID=UPI001ABC180A|nr:SDR family NAD(P)-dependent oxidoreductase [Algihabitans albus]
MSKIVLITGASRGFGRLAAEALARAGHTVYASMRNTASRNAAEVDKIKAFSKANGVDLRAVDLDVQSQGSVDTAIAKVIAEAGRIDVVMHNAGHMAFGPVEAFSPEQFAELYDINVVSAQRVNRAVLPPLDGNHSVDDGGGLTVRSIRDPFDRANEQVAPFQGAEIESGHFVFGGGVGRIRVRP